MGTARSAVPWPPPNMTPTLVIINPNAAGGRALTAWEEIQPILESHAKPLQVSVTHDVSELPHTIQQAIDSGIHRFVTIGGDGTNNSVINALAPYLESHPDLTFGCIPVGTGRDWARGIGLSFDVRIAARMLKTAAPLPIDLGSMTQNQNEKRYFLNIASVGLGGEVDRRVNMAKERRPWTFLAATVSSIISYKPQAVSIRIDGKRWYEKEQFLVVVANGRTFGRGMQIAPRAKFDDGLLDVVLVRGVSRLSILSALWRVYTASHLSHPAVMYTQASEVIVESNSNTPLPIDIDGEYATGTRLVFTAEKRRLQFLAPQHPIK